MPLVRHTTLGVEKEVPESQLPNLGPFWKLVPTPKDKPEGKGKKDSGS